MDETAYQRCCKCNTLGGDFVNLFDRQRQLVGIKAYTAGFNLIGWDIRTKYAKYRGIYFYHDILIEF